MSLLKTNCFLGCYLKMGKLIYSMLGIVRYCLFGCLRGGMRKNYHIRCSHSFGGWRNLFSCIGFGVCVGSFFVLLIIFLYAFFCNNMRFSIAINLFGEAYLELCLFLVSLPFALYSIHYYGRKRLVRKTC